MEAEHKTDELAKSEPLKKKVSKLEAILGKALN
jgi:hypothetical protein